MLNLIVIICNDYKICLSWQHLDATSDGAVLQPMHRPTSRCNYWLGLSTTRCNQWWGRRSTTRCSDGASPKPKMQPEMQPVIGPLYNQMQPVIGPLYNQMQPVMGPHYTQMQPVMGLSNKQIQTLSYYYLHRKLLLFARMMLEHDISYPEKYECLLFCLCVRLMTDSFIIIYHCLNLSSILIVYSNTWNKYIISNKFQDMQVLP